MSPLLSFAPLSSPSHLSPVLRNIASIARGGPAATRDGPRVATRMGRPCGHARSRPTRAPLTTPPIPDARGPPAWRLHKPGDCPTAPPGMAWGFPSQFIKPRCSWPHHKGAAWGTTHPTSLEPGTSGFLTLRINLLGGGCRHAGVPAQRLTGRARRLRSSLCAPQASGGARVPRAGAWPARGPDGPRGGTGRVGRPPADSGAGLSRAPQAGEGFLSPVRS